MAQKEEQTIREMMEKEQRERKLFDQQAASTANTMARQREYENKEAVTLINVQPQKKDLTVIQV
ncbi:10225_t:CDS:2 [Entrophospora sp. SA101]|nr:10225_t:CDS:2 [Entrophospora sp. SA101]